MADIEKIPAEARERAGKGPARAARRAGRVPAVIYGAKKEPTNVSLEAKELNRVINAPGFFANLFDIEVGGKKERVLPRDVQFHPLSDLAEHVDFLRVSASTTVTVAVPATKLSRGSQQ